ncbi:MAG: membrane protein insertase YidC [Desulfuromonadales bacterium]|nr:membrane protein insertase YidC [Desulfuromonadales bacterium]
MEENNKNLIIALTLMAVVWLGYNFLFPAQPAPPVTATTEVVTPPTTVGLSSKADEPAALPVTASLTNAVNRHGVENTDHLTDRIETTSTEERMLLVETDLYRLQLSSVGAVVKSIELKKYRQEADSDAPFTVINSPSLQLATLRSSGTEEFSLSAQTPFSLSTTASSLNLSRNDSQTVVFTARTPSGALLEKSYTFYADRYTIDLTQQLTNTSLKPLRGQSSLTLVELWDDSDKGAMYEFVGPMTLVGEEVETVAPKDLKKGSKSFIAPVWSGFETKYFMSVAVPLNSAAEQVKLELTAQSVENTFISPLMTLAPQETRKLDYLLYFGPRDPDQLQIVGHRLVESIDYGFFAIIAEPLVHILKFFYGYIGNYGVSIILLTILIKALFWPLTHKSYASMKAMQQLQPEITKLKEKYKNDREKMNKAVMEMYKEKKVNPVGGCLPMLVQIPVFFALYRALLGTIDLRHASFGLWLTDLSAKDPYYITPVVMGITMFIQQKMSPSTMDPTQAKIFMFMPIIFTFLFLNFPSGLVIYWLVNNVLTIAQQYFINKKPS